MLRMLRIDTTKHETPTVCLSIAHLMHRTFGGKTLAGDNFKSAKHNLHICEIAKCQHEHGMGLIS